MIHMNVFINHFKGLNFDMEAKLKISPRGNAKSNVTPNSSRVFANPSRRLKVTFQNIMYNMSFHTHTDRAQNSVGNVYLIKYRALNYQIC